MRPCCQFIEKPAHEIQALLDQATQERLISGESNALDGIEFSDDAVLDALKGVDEAMEPDLILILTIVMNKSLKKKH